jgi:hypothetical protein
MPDTQVIDNVMLDRIKAIGLPEVKENNQWLVVHVKGDGKRAPESWNAKVYKNSVGAMKVVTTSLATLTTLLECKDHCVDCGPQKSAQCEEDSIRIISIDDSGWGCETDDAEVLTKRGWHSCYGLKKDDYVLSYSDDGTIRWSPILNIDIHPFNGKINQFKHRRISIRITPDHHMKVLRRVFKGNAVKHTSKLVGFRTEYIHSSDLRSNDRIPQTGEWVGTDAECFILPSIEQVKHDSFPHAPIKIKMDDWLAFFGIWLAEGGTGVARRDGHVYDYMVRLHQNAGTDTAERMRGILKRLPFSFGEVERSTVKFGVQNQQIVFTIHNKQLYIYLKQFGDTYSKYIPRDILDLPPERLDTLIEHMFYGDGNSCYTHNGKSLHQRYYTSSPKLRDCLQEIIVKTGRSFSTRVKNGKMNTCDNFDTSINSTKWCVVGNMVHTTPHYEGSVFDLSIADDRSFLVRRDGKSYFTGNCPIGGVLFGVHDSLTGKILFTEVGMEYFRVGRFARKDYLEQAGTQVMGLLDELGIKDRTDIVFKICPGYVNNGIAHRLGFGERDIGYLVKRETIGEPLQSALEAKHREYIKELVKEDVYYDPKELDRSNISRAYSDVMAWIQMNNAWHLAKTGWKSMANYRRDNGPR